MVAETFIASLDDLDYAVSLPFLDGFWFFCFIMSREVLVADPKELGEILMRVVFPAMLSVNGYFWVMAWTLEECRIRRVQL